MSFLFFDDQLIGDFTNVRMSRRTSPPTSSDIGVLMPSQDLAQMVVYIGSGYAALGRTKERHI